MDFLRKLMGWTLQEEEESGGDGAGSEDVEEMEEEGLEEEDQEWDSLYAGLEGLRRRSTKDDNRYY